MQTHSFRSIVFLLVASTAYAQAQTPSKLPDTMVVVASRAPLGGSGRLVQVITRDRIDHSSARNIAELLSFEGGVDVYGRSAAQADVSLRGSTAEQTLVLVDGVRVSDFQSSHYAMDLAVPLRDVERIEILRGANSALFGPDAVGGVINIVTRRSVASPELQLSGGAFGTVGVSAVEGVQSGALRLTTSGAYDRSDGFRQGTDHEIGQGRLSVRAPLGAGTFMGNVGVGIRDFGANTFYGPYDSKERTAALTADASWVVPVGSWTLTTTGSTRRHSDDFILIRDNPSIYENHHTSWQSTGQIVARGAARQVSWALGAEGIDATLSSNNLGERSEWRDAGFGELTFGNPEKTAIDVGIRGDHSSIYGEFASPSVAGSLPVVPHVRLHASASRGFRAPTWTERYYTDPVNQGNADLQPERFWTGDIGLRVSRGAAPLLDVTYFTRKAEHLIDWVKPVNPPANAPWVATNVGTATYRGMEASLTMPEWRGIQSSFSWNGLSFDDNQGDGLLGKYALRPITKQFTARASTSPITHVRVTLELLAARRMNEDGYVTGGARVEWRRDRLGLTLDVQNLTNASWLDASGVRVAGRGLYAGIVWR